MSRLKTPLLYLILTLPWLSYPATADHHRPWILEQRSPYNAKVQQTSIFEHTALLSSKKPWRVCVLVPHLKDAYWIGIDYGLVTQATQLGIELELFEAGSYYDKDRQLAQLEHCMQQAFDAVLLGSVDPLLLRGYQGQVNKPIIALVNRLDSELVTTRIGVNWYQMGWIGGDYIRQLLTKAASKDNIRLALLTGPEKVGGTTWVEQGAIDALANSPVIISSNRHADNNRNLYRDQLHHLLKDHVPDYILGSAVAIEAAIGALQHQQLDTKVTLVSSYLSPAVLRGLYRQKVAFSADDQVVLQGKLAIDIVVRELQGAAAFGDIGPKIIGLHQEVPSAHQLSNSLAPADFYPIYRVTASNKGTDN